MAELKEERRNVQWRKSAWSRDFCQRHTAAKEQEQRKRVLGVSLDWGWTRQTQREWQKESETVKILRESTTISMEDRDQRAEHRQEVISADRLEVTERPSEKVERARAQKENLSRPNYSGNSSVKSWTMDLFTLYKMVVNISPPWD